MMRDQRMKVSELVQIKIELERKKWQQRLDDNFYSCVYTRSSYDDLTNSSTRLFTTNYTISQS